ncbi:MAG: MotA/TolQ/ExbB proton channel family protein [Formosimonas sp.]
MNTAQYGLLHFWAQGDAVTHVIAVILFTMSVVSWSVMGVKAWRLWATRQQAQVASQQFWHSKNLTEGVALLGDVAQPNPFRDVAQDGLNAVQHHAASTDDLHGALSVNEWLSSCLRRSLDNSSARLNRGLSVLASIGSTAPFVGLFGTVWGIYHALLNIGSSGSAGIDQVAGPVGEALIMTALGLAVAIPAVLGYNTLLRSTKGVVAQLHNFAHDIHAYFITGSRVNSDKAGV